MFNAEVTAEADYFEDCPSYSNPLISLWVVYRFGYSTWKKMNKKGKFLEFVIKYRSQAQGPRKNRVDISAGRHIIQQRKGTRSDVKLVQTTSHILLHTWTGRRGLAFIPKVNSTTNQIIPLMDYAITAWNAKTDNFSIQTIYDFSIWRKLSM